MSQDYYRFFKKTICFGLINICIYLFFAYGGSTFVKQNSFKNWETESNFLIIPNNQKYDLIFLGTSHGRIFSRASNHGIVEKVLNKKLLNLSRGSGGGIAPALINMLAFYHKGNKVDRVIYFIDPWIFYSSNWNEK